MKLLARLAVLPVIAAVCSLAFIVGNGTGVATCTTFTISGTFDQSGAISTDGSLWVWGLSYGATPVKVSGLSNVSSVALPLILTSDGRVWTLNPSGPNPTVTLVTGVSNVIAISSSNFDNLAVEADGSVWAWGDDRYGQLGNGTASTTPTTTPTQVTGLTNVVRVSSGWYFHELALKSDGTLWAWGLNRRGQLGDGTTTNRSTPVQTTATGFSNIVAIATGSEFSLAMTSDGKGWSWGSENYGALGYTGGGGTPTQIPNLSTISGLATGEYHSLSLNADATASAWGMNANGELGNSSNFGTTADNDTPTVIAGLSSLSALAGGDFHSLGLKQNGTLWAWGRDDSGQLGSTGPNTYTPVQVPGLTVAQPGACANYGVAATPTGVSGQPGNHSVALTWTEPNNGNLMPLQYIVTPYIGGTAQAPIQTGGTATSFTVTGLTNGTPYTFTVAAQNGAGTSPPSAPSAAVTPDLAPNPPGTPSPTAGSSSDVSLTWSAPSPNGGTALTAYVVTPYLQGIAQAPVNTGSTSTTYDVTGLTCGAQYTFTVAARNTLTGAASAQSTAATPNCVPGQVGTPGAAAGVNRDATVTWSTPTANGGTAITGYKITPRLNGSAQAPVSVPVGNTFTLTGLTCGGSYTFTVAAQNAAGAGAASPASAAVVPNCTPNVPGTPAAIAGTGSNVQLNWTAPSGNGGTAITQYVVTPYLSGVAQGQIGTGGSATGFNVTGLACGGSYTFTVAAQNAAGTGAASGTSATAIPNCAPAAPGTPSPTAGVNRDVQLTWSTPSGNGGTAITQYVITPYLAGVAQSPVGTGSTLAGFNATNLTCGGSYTFTVAAQNAAGTGAASAQSAIAVPNCVPGTVATPSATAGNSSDATVGWSAPAANGGTPITGYLVTPYLGGVAQSAIPAGAGATSIHPTLTCGGNYTFTVAAQNAAGGGAASPLSPPAVPNCVPGVAGTPVGTFGDTQVSLSWSTPTPNGGTAITGYTVTPYIGGNAQTPISTGSASPTYVVTSLANGTPYTFTVTAQNAAGLGPASAASLPVTPHVAPVVSASGASGTYAKGDLVTLTYTVTNPSSGSALTLSNLESDLPAGLLGNAQMLVRVAINGGAAAPCTATSTPSCALDPGQRLTVRSLQPIPVGGSVVLSITAVAAGGEQGCGLVSPSAFAETVYLDHVSAAAPFTVCQSGLGMESWWSYVQRAVGSQGTASVNVANGNLVVQQTDSLPVQAHGHLAYVLRRTYNSQEAAGLLLPGRGIGAGWMLDIGQADALAGAGVTASGLYIPSIPSFLNQVTNPLGVTYIDRDGTRHLFTPRAIPAVGVSGLSGPQQVLSPAALTPDAGFDTVQVDEVYDPPAGVHLGLWRYVESCSTGCATPQVLGYGAERTDRLRYEFAADGRLLSMIDASGVQLRYVYDSQARLIQVYEPRSCPTPPAPPVSSPLTPAPPAASLCRTYELQYAVNNGLLTVTIWDPSGGYSPSGAPPRPTTYLLDGGTLSSHLVEVDNPDGSRLHYTYGSGCSISTQQLCSVVDGNGGTTRFTYGPGALGGAPPAVTGITDRQGNPTTLTYPDPTMTVVDRSGERQLFSAIDARGRVGRLDEGDTSGTNPYLRSTSFTWDTSNVTCRQPDARVDNNLCRRVQYAAPGTPTTAPTSQPGKDQDVQYLYSDEGSQLLTRQNLGASAPPAPGSTCASCIDRTWGYSVQYVQPSGASQTFSDTVQGSGLVSSGGSRPSSTAGSNQTLFPIVDRVQQLTPEGNDPAKAGSNTASCPVSPAYSCFLSTSLVEANPSANPNAVPGGGAQCATPGSPAYNSGLLCEQDQALDVVQNFDGSLKRSVTRYQYDAFGQKTLMTTPKAIEESLAGSYSYTYYADGETDLNGGVSAGGWLKAVTDPTGQYSFFAYDRAGFVARTWDRNTTHAAGVPVATFNPLSGGFSQTTHGIDLSSPWRFVTSTRDAMGNLTSYTVDSNGNRRAIRPPRGNLAGGSGYDTVQTFDANDNLLTTLAPAEAAGHTATVYHYDAFDNVADVTDPNGSLKVMTHDGVNRLVETRWVRDAAGVYAPGCRTSDPVADAPIPANQTVCLTAKTYDGLDNVVGDQAANAHSGGFTPAQDIIDPRGATANVTKMTYDAASRLIDKKVPRASAQGVYDESATDYDRDGNAIRLYAPRAFSEGPANVFVTVKKYDPGDRQRSSVAVRGAYSDSPSLQPCRGSNANDAPIPLDWVVCQTNVGLIDADGNQTLTIDSQGRYVQYTYDILDRKVAEAQPRSNSNGPLNTTTYSYDFSGNTTAVTRPGNLITAYSYDADNRVVDTVEGADSTNANAANLVDAAGTKNVRHRNYYDADGHLVATIDPRQFKTTSGPLTTATFMVRTDYDADGRPTAQWVPYSDSTLAQEPLAGSGQCPTPNSGRRPDTVSGVPDYASSAGICVTRTKYDPAGNRKRVTLPTATASPSCGTGGNQYITYTYTADNLVKWVDAPSPDISAQRVTAQIISYDGAGRVVSSSDAMSHTWTTTYTDDGLPLSQSLVGTNHTTMWTYDANGNKLTETDGKSQTTRYVYYQDNLVKDVYDPALDQTHYVYDGEGHPILVKSPLANSPGGSTHPPVYSFYTDDNLLLAQDEFVKADASVLRVTSYTYDGAGRKLTQKVTEQPVGSPSPITDGGTQTFSYAPDGRLVQETGRSVTGVTSPGSTITYTYDPAGNRTGVSDSSSGSSVTTSYYANDLPITVNDGSRTSSFTYDGGGARVARADGGGAATKLTTYAYSDAGLPCSMASAVGGTTLWTFDASGRMKSETDGNGQVVTDDYTPGDVTLRKVTLSSSSGGAALAQWSYVYDNDFLLQSQTFTGTGAANSPPVSGTMAYGYDAANRVNSFTQGTGTPIAIAWDRNGNRTQYGTKTFSYGADNALVGSTDSAVPNSARLYSYNVFGGLIDDQCSSYSFDAMDRLARVAPDTAAPRPADCPTPPVTPGQATPPQLPSPTTYAYDGLDRQINSGGPGGANLHYDGLGQDVTLMSGGSNNADTAYAAVTPSLTRKALQQATGGQIEYLADDGRGNISTVTTANTPNANPAVTCTAIYDPFGLPLSPVSGTPNPTTCNTGTSQNDVWYRGGRQDG
ncbi:MAG TPA: fibronectin type III domain-containing protein, partial [Candidatus Dormibacteraeota bacterium]|nr:fibronectin type III domain-containing protein [Candidatus Dormibacteraeota bacterium]